MRLLVRQHDGNEIDIDLATAVEWIRDGRLAPDSSVFDAATNRWRRADTLASLEQAFEAAVVEEKTEPLRAVAATAHEFADLLLKLAFGAIAVTVPMMLGLILGGFVLIGAVTHSAESFMVVVSALALIVVTPYVASVFQRRLDEDAYAKTYGAALKRTGHAVEPMRTALVAFAIHRGKYQLLSISLILASALIHYFAVQSDISSTRFTMTLGIAIALLMILRGHLLERRIANGLFGTNAYEARELIEFVLQKARRNNISGLGSQPFVIPSEQVAFLVDHEPQEQS